MFKTFLHIWDGACSYFKIVSVFKKYKFAADVEIGPRVVSVVSRERYYYFYVECNFQLRFRPSVGGIMVNIAAFQAVDPGSIPGRRIFYFD